MDSSELNHQIPPRLRAGVANLVSYPGTDFRPVARLQQAGGTAVDFHVELPLQTDTMFG